MTDGLICINCPHSAFLDPKKEICYKTGGLMCKKLGDVVGKYEPCRLPLSAVSGKAPRTLKKRRGG